MAVKQETLPATEASERRGAGKLHRALLSELRSRLAQLYASRLIGVYLFGSYARGEADADSDLDILIVLDRVPDYDAEIERTSRLISGLSLEYDISLSRVFMSQERWSQAPTSFVRNVRAEAIPA